VKFAPKRSAAKWTSNKMGNAKKGRDKMVTPKRRAFLAICNTHLGLGGCLN